MFVTVARTADGVRLLDQRRLPAEEVYLTLRSAAEVAEAIRQMMVRGAPAIGVTAAFGVALAASRAAAEGRDVRLEVEAASGVLVAARPTAVDPEVDGVAGEMMRVTRPADARIVTPAPAGGVDRNRAEVVRDLIHDRPQARI